jgi:tetratricopeptide (TPR) repeat protein
MSLRSIITLHRAARLSRKGKRSDAAGKLRSAMERGGADFRLAIRMALASGDFHELAKAAAMGRGGRAAWVFLAQDAASRGEHDKAEEYAQKALIAAPENVTAQALLVLARFGKTGDAAHLKSRARDLPHASTRAQALILMAVEKAIAAADPSGRGAEEKEDTAGGIFGWAFDLLDDLAVWIYWIISLALNLTLNAADGAKRAVYWQVIGGDRLEGLRKPALAMEKFKKALELGPECVEALESMVKHSMAVGEYGAAEEYLARLIQVAGESAAEDPSIRKWKGDLEFFLGRFENAMPIYESLETIFPLSYIIPYRIGFCALALGAAGKAAPWFEKALSQINPGLIAERVGRCPPRAASSPRILAGREF